MHGSLGVFQYLPSTGGDSPIYKHHAGGYDRLFLSLGFLQTLMVLPPLQVLLAHCRVYWRMRMQ